MRAVLVGAERLGVDRRDTVAERDVGDLFGGVVAFRVTDLVFVICQVQRRQSDRIGAVGQPPLPPSMPALLRTATDGEGRALTE